MNWWYTLLFILVVPLVICTIWEVIDYLTDKAAEPPTCDCGRYFMMPDGDCVDSRGTVHGWNLCQPQEEVL